MRRLVMSILLLGIGMMASAQDNGKITREKYIEEYKELAMREMQRTGIPASITLAQGCLESDNGNSSLSVKGNNHFGIKCHEWEGAKMYHDDDERDECFRKYKNPYESYTDHSEFLTGKSRYEFLFDLKPTDYKGWARGLQKAGYATSRKYAALLIKIIEENDLHDYDKIVLSGSYKPGKLLEKNPRFADHGNDSVPVRQLYINNRVEYIITGTGDEVSMLREELGLYPNEIYRYNDLQKGTPLDSGMVIYLQPKRFRAQKGAETHFVGENETLRSISQYYAVRINSLRRMNNLVQGEELEPGSEINLRRRIRMNEVRGGETIESVEEQPEMEFQFDGS